LILTPQSRDLRTFSPAPVSEYYCWLTFPALCSPYPDHPQIGPQAELVAAIENAESNSSRAVAALYKHTLDLLPVVFKDVNLFLSASPAATSPAGLYVASQVDSRI
jgi:hypothetical protein